MTRLTPDTKVALDLAERIADVCQEQDTLVALSALSFCLAACIVSAAPDAAEAFGAVDDIDEYLRSEIEAADSRDELPMPDDGPRVLQ